MDNPGLRNDKTYHVYRELCTFSTKLSTILKHKKIKGLRRRRRAENGGDGYSGDEKRRKSKS